MHENRAPILLGEANSTPTGPIAGGDAASPLPQNPISAPKPPIFFPNQQL